MPRYSIRKNRIMEGSHRGFFYDPEENPTALTFDPGEIFHAVFLKGIDSTVKGAEWGRLSFKAVGSDEAALTVYILSTDNRERLTEAAGMDIDKYLCGEEADVREKTEFLKRMGAIRINGCSDCLLYDVSGQYIFIAIEVSGEGSLNISDIVLDSTGDNFMATYPEVYRQRNSFFHRYVSVFSSIYNDFQRDIDSLSDVLDLDKCNEEQLIIYGGWMGMDLSGGFLEEDVLRQLVKEAYSLNRMKGTRKAVERILEIILREKPVIIEHNLVRSAIMEEEIELPENFKARGIYDVTILVKRHITEELRHQALYILNQYKPLRTRISMAQLDERPTADSNSYLDINTRLPEESKAVLDQEISMDGITVLL